MLFACMFMFVSFKFSCESKRFMQSHKRMRKACIHTDTHVILHVHTCTNLNAHTHTYARTHTHIYTHAHTHTHSYTYKRKHAHITHSHSPTHFLLIPSQCVAFSFALSHTRANSLSHAPEHTRTVSHTKVAIMHSMPQVAEFFLRKSH